MSVHYATKAYVIGYTEALAQELARSGFHVTASCPGPVATESTGSAFRCCASRRGPSFGYLVAWANSVA